MEDVSKWMNIYIYIYIYIYIEIHKYNRWYTSGILNSNCMKQELNMNKIFPKDIFQEDILNIRYILNHDIIC